MPTNQPIQQVQGQQEMYTPPSATVAPNATPAPSAGTSTPANTGNNFNPNNSVVDYLNSTGQASSFQDRTALAATHGITGYTGTAAQNMALLSRLQGNSHQTNGGISGSASVTQNQGMNNTLQQAGNAINGTQPQADPNAPRVNADGTTTYSNGMIVDANGTVITQPTATASTNVNKQIQNSVIDPTTGATTVTYTDGTSEIKPVDPALAPIYEQAKLAKDNQSSAYQLELSEHEQQLKAKRDQLERDKKTALDAAKANYAVGGRKGAGSDENQFLSSIEEKYNRAIAQLDSDSDIQKERIELRNKSALENINNQVTSGYNSYLTNIQKVGQSNLNEWQAGLTGTDSDNLQNGIQYYMQKNMGNSGYTQQNAMSDALADISRATQKNVQGSATKQYDFGLNHISGQEDSIDDFKHIITQGLKAGYSEEDIQSQIKQVYAEKKMQYLRDQKSLDHTAFMEAHAMRMEALSFSKEDKKFVTDVNDKISRYNAYKDTVDMKRFAENTISALDSKTGISDIAAINQFQKVIDSGAVTRDKDVELIKSAQSLADRLETKVKSLKKGDKLSDIQRKQIKDAVDKLLKTQVTSLKNDPYVKSKIKEVENNGYNVDDTILSEFTGFETSSQKNNAVTPQLQEARNKYKY